MQFVSSRRIFSPCLATDIDFITGTEAPDVLIYFTVILRIAEEGELPK